MKAGALDRSVWIERTVGSFHDGLNQQPGQWEPYITRKAQVIRSRGREVFENQGRDAEVPVTFLLRSDSKTRQITEQHRVVFEGSNFDIKSVNEIGRREGIEIVGIARD